MSKIRECFTSRWGDRGVIVEVDYSQLEVVVLAFLSQDENLISDIKNDLDMHIVSLSWITGDDYDDLKNRYDSGDTTVASMRKAAKRPRFELQYGAGPKTIADNNKWTMSKAREYIRKYYERYPQVKEWQEEVARQVEANKINRKGWVEKGGELISHYICPHTNRRYVFTSYPDKMGNPRFSPTQMKNYPVQGFATADLVPTVLGELNEELIKRNIEDCVLINTVHDSIMFDVHDTSLNQLVELIDDVLDGTDRIMNKYYGIEMNIPLKYNINHAPSWGGIK